MVLRERYGLDMFGDLANPVRTTAEAVPGLFRKAGPGPVRYTPVIALGLETVTRGGWYAPGDRIEKREVWSYRVKNTANDLKTGANLPPALNPGAATEFDPGETPFGLWVANDGLPEAGAFSEPKAVRVLNPGLAPQPYKAMIYPNRDKATGLLIPRSYLIGWEYSTNDDFQDVVCRVDNVALIPTGSP